MAGVCEGDNRFDAGGFLTALDDRSTAGAVL